MMKTKILLAVLILSFASPLLAKVNVVTSLQDLASIADVLRPGGLLAVAELPGDPDAVTQEQLRTLTQGAGLKFVDSLRVSRGFLASFRRGRRSPRPLRGDRS